MAVPKGKVSKQRRNKRRSSVWKLAAPTLVACAKCGALHLPHRMCPECGSYNGREVKVVKSVAAKYVLLCLCKREAPLPSCFLLLPHFLSWEASKSIVLLYAHGRLYYIVLASHVKKRYNELIIMWYYVLLWIRPHFA